MTSYDIEYLLRVMREDEEIRAALRREILTEELLMLPVQFIAMWNALKSMREMLGSVQDVQNSMLGRQKSILETLTSVQETQKSMLNAEREMRREIGELHDMYGHQRQDFGRFLGKYAADAARNSRGEIARPLAHLRGMRHLRIRSLSSENLNDILDEHYDAVDALDLRESAWETFDTADLIAEITARRSSTPGFYIAVEASYTVDTENLLRATDHAKILRCATGQDAYAVVAGVRIGPSIQDRVFKDSARLVEMNNEDAALWYQLAEEDVESPDPRQGC